MGLSQTVSNLASSIPGGLAAGGIMALLVSNKSARKAAQYGGAAMFGDLAFKAYQNWRSNTPATMQQASSEPVADSNEATFHQQALDQSSESQNNFELTLVKAMIAVARADGHIDAQEQQRIFQAVEKLPL